MVCPGYWTNGDDEKQEDVQSEYKPLTYEEYKTALFQLRQTFLKRFTFADFAKPFNLDKPVKLKFNPVDAIQLNSSLDLMADSIRQSAEWREFERAERLVYLDSIPIERFLPNVNQTITPLPRFADRFEPSEPIDSANLTGHMRNRIGRQLGLSKNFLNPLIDAWGILNKIDTSDIEIDFDFASRMSKDVIASCKYENKDIGWPNTNWPNVDLHTDFDRVEIKDAASQAFGQEVFIVRPRSGMSVSSLAEEFQKFEVTYPVVGGKQRKQPSLPKIVTVKGKAERKQKRKAKKLARKKGRL